MIRYILLQNRAGKTRLAKYYIPMEDQEKHTLEHEVHKLIANRDPKFTNFAEVWRRISSTVTSSCAARRAPLEPSHHCHVLQTNVTFCRGLRVCCGALQSQFKANKIIYRRYAGLFFAMCVDVTDNELAYLESIHLFVEILDHYFNNVCELDLVFNFHKVKANFQKHAPL